MKKDKIYHKELFKKLHQSFDLKKERHLLKQVFRQPILIALSEIGNLSFLSNSLCAGAATKVKRKRCLQCLGRALKKAKKSKGPEEFICPVGCFGLCLPLIRGNALYGFLLLCHLKERPSRQSQSLLEALNSTILEKVQNELELSKLYKTIRPRAVALSTVHTIHRLISSSLNLDELLPKIARLSLQVLRAKECVISLVDKKSGELVIKTAIVSSSKAGRPGNLRRITQIEKKVMKSGNILLKKSYLSMPLIDEETIGVITICGKLSGKPFDNFDQEIMTAFSEQAVVAINNAQLYKEQEDTLLGTVKSLSTLLKVKSAYPYTHSRVFLTIVLKMAKELRLSEQQLRDLRFAAMLHDAGEIGIPKEILTKPAHLTESEIRIVKEHPKESAKILSPLERLKPAIEIILHHHEKFDGTGYPDRLKGDRIPLGARIMAVADSFEAMISRRPYRKSTSISEAIEELKRQSGTQFDPQVVRVFLRLAKLKSFQKLLKGI